MDTTSDIKINEIKCNVEFDFYSSSFQQIVLNRCIQLKTFFIQQLTIFDFGRKCKSIRSSVHKTRRDKTQINKFKRNLKQESLTRCFQRLTRREKPSFELFFLLKIFKMVLMTARRLKIDTFFGVSKTVNKSYYNYLLKPVVKFFFQLFMSSISIHFSYFFGYNVSMSFSIEKMRALSTSIVRCSAAFVVQDVNILISIQIATIFATGPVNSTLGFQKVDTEKNSLITSIVMHTKRALKLNAD